MFVWNGLKHVSTACNVFSCYTFVTRLSLQRNLKTKFEMVWRILSLYFPIIQFCSSLGRKTVHIWHWDYSVFLFGRVWSGTQRMNARASPGRATSAAAPPFDSECHFNADHSKWRAAALSSRKTHTAAEAWQLSKPGGDRVWLGFSKESRCLITLYVNRQELPLCINITWMLIKFK